MTTAEALHLRAIETLKRQGFVEQPDGTWRSKYAVARITDEPGMTNRELWHIMGQECEQSKADDYSCAVIEYKITLDK